MTFLNHYGPQVTGKAGHSTSLQDLSPDLNSSCPSLPSALQVCVTHTPDTSLFMRDTCRKGAAVCVCRGGIAYASCAVLFKGLLEGRQQANGKVSIVLSLCPGRQCCFQRPLPVRMPSVSGLISPLIHSYLCLYS